MDTMSETEEKVIFHRILVALDNSQDSMAALNIAASFARLLEAELEGLFVEDDSWYQMAERGFHWEISAFTGTINPLEEHRMRLQIRAHSERIKRRLEEISERYDIIHSFRSVRGVVQKQILKATENADLITIGTFGHSVLRHGQLGSTARAILQFADKPVLLLRHGIRHGDRLTVIDNATEVSERCLETGKMLSSKLGMSLLIIRLQKDAPDEKALRNTKEIGEKIPGALYVDLSPNTTDHNFSSVIRQYKTGLLIGSRTYPLLQGNSLERLLIEVKCPMLLFP